LKQPCIQVLQITASLAQKPESRKELVVALASLLSTLQSVTVHPAALDAKLVEYAFVPISQVLRLSRQVPVRALELCLECISSLLSIGWGGGIEPALAGQLLILFTFLAKPSSADNGIAATSEELQALALKCIANLLTETSRTSRGKAATTATPNIPALGEAVLVVLDALTDAKSNHVKLQTVGALKAMVLAIDDNDALASFLPKITSSITKALTPKSGSRTGFRVTEGSLDILSLLILRLLSDEATKSLPHTSTEDNGTGTKIVRSVSWLQATAPQIKVALANVFKLRYHDKPEVLRALFRLCLRIVRECAISLADCTAMAVETAINLAGRGDDQDTIVSELRKLLSADRQLGDVLRESLFSWVSSLPRTMQSKDERVRHQTIHQISVTLRLFDRDDTLIDGRLADSLVDAISVVLGDSKGLEELAGHGDTPTDQIMLLDSAPSLAFEPLKLQFKAQEDMIAEFRLLVQELARSNSATAILQDLVRTIDVGSQDVRFASFWAAIHLIQDMTKSDSVFDDLVDMGTPNLREETLDALYARSVMILTQEAEATSRPWQISALAMETIVLQASRYKVEFRAELSEVLYPVLSYLGDPNEALRHHALTCLNMLSTACGYADAGELVVANVDYIVNAVGLKLAVGDVSPQVPQVLIMMMRLCGPSLLPYLDDLVGSIFDALERYHGYSRLTELMFSVLRGMVEEGVRAPPLAITASDDNESSGRCVRTPTMADVVDTVRRFDNSAFTRKAEEAESVDLPFPQQPWKGEVASSQSRSQDDDTHQNQQSSEMQSTEPPPPAARTYDLILRISELTQHYLTTSSPSLRISLLSLLRTTIPTLAKHENSFLPLINSLWPVLLPRLQDSEAYVVSSALDVLALTCEYAGDFMRSRIDDAWELFRKILRRTQHRSDHSVKTQSLISSSADPTTAWKGVKNLTADATSTPTTYMSEFYIDAPARMVWDSLVALLCAISGHVTIKDSRFDELLLILDSVLDRDEVRRALETCNADAVWLQSYKKRKNSLEASTSHSSQSDGTNANDYRSPVGRPHWHFVSI
jgi:hypothetical protein